MRADPAQTAADDGIDRAEAQRFLKLLGIKRCVFQTFDDDQERKDRTLARLIQGRFDGHADELEALNDDGAGIFVAINETDGGGRKRENIKRVRAVTLDLDGGPLEPVRQCALKPHIIVQSSPGKHHVYYRVKGVALDLFEDVQRGLAKRFDGDPAVALLPHVARLPGFYHRKGEPFRTQIIEVNDDLPPYEADVILREFRPLKTPHKLPTSAAGKVVLSADTPLETAKEFVTRECMIEGAERPAFCLHHHRGAWYRWAGSHFAEAEDAEIIKRLYGFLDEAFTVRKQVLAPFAPTPHKVNQIVHALKHGVLLPKHKNPPFWLDDSQRPKAVDLIACRNGLVNIRSGKLLDNTPYFFNVNSLPFDYDPDAPPPKQWLRFLRELWPDDEQSRMALQEIFGLLLTADTSHQKIFMLVGPKRSGKGTIGRVLTALLGKDNVVNPTLASLSTQFGLMLLIDKRAAIISDARLGARVNGNAVAERLLSISGEDAHSIDRKYNAFWTGHLTARFLILTNELPRIDDASGALASRFVLLTMTNSFYGREDRKLTARLLRELPGILNWSLDGLDRLHERGHFEMPPSSTEAIRTLEDLASPVGAFIREWCDVGPTERIKVKLAYDAWVQWCERNGHNAGSNAVFGRNLRAAFPRVLTRGAGVERFYQGIGLNQYGEERFDDAERGRS